MLRSGGDFGPEWVLALRQGLDRHLSGFRFVCLTDVAGLGPTGCPLEHGWPGWWSKVELFRPGLFSGPVLYVDLDTLPWGDLSEIAAYRGPFAMLSDFYGPRAIASGVMMWTPSADTEAIYHRFVADPNAIMRSHRARSDFWYAKVVPEPDRIQDLFPGQVVSLKKHAREGPPDGARLVCGHGKPRFSDPSAGWAHKAWKSLARAA